MNKPIKIDDLMAKDYGDVMWLVKDLIPAQGITIISGDPGGYKTWILLCLIKAVASSEKLFGYFDCAHQNVLLIDEENHPCILKQRFELLGIKSGLDIHLLVREGFHADDEDYLKYVLNYIDNNKIGLVCVDSLVRIHSKEENVANQMSALFSAIGQFTKHGATTILTHHHRKQSANGSWDSSNLRGSSDILAAVDSHISVKKSKDFDSVELVQKKLRIAPEHPAIDIKVDKTTDGKISFIYDGNAKTISEIKRENIDGRICDLFNEDKMEMNRDQINSLLKKEFGINAIGDALKRLFDSGQLKYYVKGRNKKIYYPSIYEDEIDDYDDSTLDENGNLKVRF
jgi:hypothetical protein